MSRYTPVSVTEIESNPALSDWAVVDGALVGRFVAPSFAGGGALTAAIAAAADAADHHPDLELHYPGRVTVTLSTHDTNGLTDADVALAIEISALAAGAGADPA